jgi:hypothetical protein
VGNRFDIFFWTDPWLGGTPLSVRFDRLFDLVVHESSTVAGINALDSGRPLGLCGCSRDSCWHERWRCWGMSDFTSQFLFAGPVFRYLAVAVRDSTNGYSVRDAYQLLLHRIWFPWLLLKTSFGINRFPWRFWYLLGDYCEIGYQQKQIWYLMALW